MKRHVVLVADPYPPYQYLDGDRVVGVDHDLVKAAFRVHDLEVETSLHSWNTCLELLENARADGLFQIQPTPEREKQFIFSVPLRTARTVFWQNVSNPIDLKQYKTLEQMIDNHTLGLVEGYSYHPEIDGLNHPNQKMVSSQEASLLGVSQNDFSLALMDGGVAEYLSSKLEITNIEQAVGFEIKRRLHVAFRKDLADMARLFDSGLGEIDARGLRQEIYDAYNLSG